MILNILLDVVTLIINQEYVSMITGETKRFCITSLNVKFSIMIYYNMISVHDVIFLEKCYNNNSPAFELLQLSMVQHTSHVLIHLLQIHIGKKAFLLQIHKLVNFLQFPCLDRW